MARFGSGTAGTRLGGHGVSKQTPRNENSGPTGGGCCGPSASWRRSRSEGRRPKGEGESWERGEWGREALFSFPTRNQQAWGPFSYSVGSGVGGSLSLLRAEPRQAGRRLRWRGQRALRGGGRPGGVRPRLERTPALSLGAYPSSPTSSLPPRPRRVPKAESRREGVALGIQGPDARRGWGTGGPPSAGGLPLPRRGCFAFSSPSPANLGS